MFELFGKKMYVFVVYFFLRQLNMGDCNSPFWKAANYISCTVDVLDADGLAMQGVRTPEWY